MCSLLRAKGFTPGRGCVQFVASQRFHGIPAHFSTRAGLGLTVSVSGFSSVSYFTKLQ